MDNYDINTIKSEKDSLFSTKVTKKNDIYILELIGLLNANESYILKDILDELLQSDVTNFILDFNELQFLSSMGIREILKLGKKLSNNKGNLRMCRMKREISELLRMTGILSYYKNFETIEQATSDLKNQLKNIH